MAKGGGDSKGNSSLAGNSTEPGGLLRGESTNTTDAKKTSKSSGSCIDLWELVRSGPNAVHGEGASGRDTIKVVVLRRIIWAFEHVQHLGRNDEASNDVNRRQSSCSGTKNRYSWTGTVSQKMHSTEGRGATDGVRDGHERTVQCM